MNFKFAPFFGAFLFLAFFQTNAWSYSYDYNSETSECIFMCDNNEGPFHCTVGSGDTCDDGGDIQYPCAGNDGAFCCDNVAANCGGLVVNYVNGPFILLPKEPLSKVTPDINVKVTPTQTKK